MRRRWAAVLAGIIVLSLSAGCGRVNLEDLTPEAVRTELAGRPTPTPRASTGSPGTSPVSGEGQGNRAAGLSLYNTWCSGCHDTGRLNAPVIKGKTYNFKDYEAMLRGLPENTKTHPSYKVTELNDNNFEDIFAYIASP